ncbi:MAG: ABC transporter ATP-binding protein [Gemmataceae bacterium]
MAELAILARGVHKSYQSGGIATPILENAGLGIARGEIVFLVGPSGSGKTTLLSILGCILRPDQGSVQILDQEVTRLSPKQLTRFRCRHLGFIFQTFNLFPTLSALDNVLMTLVMRRWTTSAARVRALEVLAQVGLKERAHLSPARLSTGECQRVAIARALANQPAILLADEPTASLDTDNGQSVMQLLTRLVRERGMTLIVVTHDNRIFPYADRIVHLENRRLVRATRPGNGKLPVQAQRRPELRHALLYR